MAAANYVQNLPSMSAYEIGYELGYRTEKLAESILLSKEAGAAARYERGHVNDVGLYTKLNAMNAKSKALKGLVILIILIMGVYLFTRKVETTIYIGIANPSENIDLLVKIDGSIVVSDTIAYNPFKYKIIKKHLRAGFYKLYVHSRKEHLTEERSIFLIFNQHVVIEYFPKTDGDGETASFFVRNRLTPFYLE